MGIDNVADVSRRAQYNASAAQTVFPYTFPIFDEDDLVVQVDGATQTITTDYTVDGVEDDDGGNVTFVVPMAGGEVITIYSDTAIQRLSDFAQNGPNLATVMNDELDRITIVQQELRDGVNRGLRLAPSDPSSAPDLVLPEDRANMFLAFDALRNPIASSGTGNDSALRTDLASTSVSSDGSRLSGFRRDAAGSVALSVYDKLSIIASTQDFGASESASAATNAAALAAALAVADVVEVVAGTYAAPIDISADDKTLVVNSGVIVKLPDGTVEGVDLTGPDVLKVSGDRVTIISNGNLTVDGNRQNNDATGFAGSPTTVLAATLKISGDHYHQVGKVKIKDWYYRGVVVENGNDTGDEVDSPHIDGIEYVCDPDDYDFAGVLRYSLMMWTVKDWWIGEICGSAPDGWHTRLRFGSQSSDSGECLRGRVGAIHGNFVLVTESNTNGLQLPWLTIAGGKYEDSANVTAEGWNVNGALLTVDYSGPSFAMIGCTNCDYGARLQVRGHNQTLQAVAFTQGNVNCRGGTVSVSGTTVAQKDLVIGLNDGLSLGNLQLLGGAGATHGLEVQYDANSKHITIGEIESRAHATEDITIASNVGTNQMLRIRGYNKDAVKTIGSGHGRGTFTWTTGTSSQVITDPTCVSTSSVRLEERNAAAAVVMNAKGRFATPGAGSFTIATSDGSNIGGNADYYYEIENAL